MNFNLYRRWNDIPAEAARAFAEILTEAFPEDERRELGEVQALVDSSPLELLMAEEAGHTLGILMLWDLPEFLFLENFAVRPACRGRGLGKEMLDFTRSHWDKPTVLEVEPPETEICRRRIGFYGRNGFVLNSQPYEMPCLHGDGPSVPLVLMSRPEPLSDRETLNITRTLYEQVYRGKNQPDLEKIWKNR